MDTSRNIYKNDVDFAALALQYPDFAKHLKQNNQLDFSNPDAVQQLTKSLLKRDFGLNVDLPDDRLCPAVPNRLNYILWLQDLIDFTTENYSDVYDQERVVYGLDIGTGASCIYPLLGCALRPRWRFAATDIDSKNLKYARDNVKKNELDSRIHVIETTSSCPLIPFQDINIPQARSRLDFTMCNPPFYESREELISAARAKQRPPFSACTGAEVEMITTGGEVEFVTRLIKESMQLRDRVQWYTSMVGKFSSVATLVNTLHDEGNKNWAIAEFVQGTKTRRWGIGWSWMDYRPSTDIARPRGQSIPKHLLPFPSEFTICCPPSTSLSRTIEKINSALTVLDMSWNWNTKTFTGLGFAMGNVWSRHARRQKEKEQAVEVGTAPRTGSENTADTTRYHEGEGGQGTGDTHGDFIPGDQDKGAKIGLKVSMRRTMKGEINVVVRWVKGFDSVVFESFCGFLKRKVEGR
ncbi:hypothetical protein ACO22_04956 [Paracoccidioides brasiliensis]|uniref:U6 small nuclear RNA (adenine-(43)-N(6))-methyltransferase n=1 Tax=Paracoccidioides brasiliensis TaxID=121759 RepID=A0A1D2JBP0_PARBR|nr:hypothetical protein ACO22_04956 [Paracoccidioides brasiliensis]